MEKFGCVASLVVPPVSAVAGGLIAGQEGAAAGLVIGTSAVIFFQAAIHIRTSHQPPVNYSPIIYREGWYAVEYGKKKAKKTSELKTSLVGSVINLARLEEEKKEKKEQGDTILANYNIQAKKTATQGLKPVEVFTWKSYKRAPELSNILEPIEDKIKELDGEIDSEKSTIDALEAQIEQIEGKYERLLELSSIIGGIAARSGDDMSWKNTPENKQLLQERISLETEFNSLQ